MRKTKILRSKIGISGSIVICIILLVRMAVPFDLGLARRVLVDWSWFLKWYRDVNMVTHQIGPISLTIIQMTALVLGSVAVVFVIRFLVIYVHQITVCRENVISDAAEYKSVLQRTCEELNYRRTILLVKSNEVTSPMCVGFRTNYIILPETEFSEKELKYIFTHEITHLKHYDLYFMMLASLLNCIFWWNPLTYIIKTELDYALEVRCDIKVTTDYTREERKTYLRTILKVLDTAGRNQRPLPGNMTGFASYGYNRAMKERFQAVLNQESDKGSSKIGFRVWGLAMLGLLLCSYLFVLTPYYSIESDENGVSKNEELNSEDVDKYRWRWKIYYSFSGRRKRNRADS